MRYFGVRMPIFAVILSMGLSLSAWAMDLGYVESVYLWPTTSITTIPTAYVVPRSYYAPAAYVVPTAYTTAYVADPVIVDPAYVTTVYRRGLFRRRWTVETSLLATYGTYLPTTYVSPTYYTTSYRARTLLPTVYEYPTVWDTAYTSAATECDDLAWVAPARSTTTRSNGSSSGASAKSVRSESIYDTPTIPSAVGPPLADEPLPRAGAADQVGKAKSEVGGAKDTTPAVPAAERERTTAVPAKSAAGSGAGQGSSKTGTPADAAKTKSSPEGMPEDDNLLIPAPSTGPEAAIRRDSQKPAYLTPTRRDLRSVLVGRVESEAGSPREEVAVTVSNRRNAAIRREGMTDAYGNFAIRLTDGDWTVNVRLPSGRIYPVRTVKVTSGKVIDDREGREVRNLIISY